MQILETNESIDPVTFERRIHFSGFITLEEVQDVIHSSYGLSHEALGREFLKELEERRKTLDIKWHP